MNKIITLVSPRSRPCRFQGWPGILISLALLLWAILSGCSSSNYLFREDQPVEICRDNQPIPLPKATRYHGQAYVFDVLLRRPAVEGLKFSEPAPARDVNSLDEVPASSWFNRRLGYQEISPEVLLKGPERVGPPQLPFTVVKAKKSGNNPGFIIEDRRGHGYLIKFDPPDFPAIETATALIVNRLFWGFGYNVPEDYLVYFTEADLIVKPGGELSSSDVQAVLGQVAAPVDGRYRSTASLLIEGIFLGPITATGVRKDDPNDHIPHQDRRTLRALRMFGAFTNHSDIRIDNTADFYIGEPGKGYIKHYLLDFGEAFGGHAAEHDYRWDGYEHMFSYNTAFKNFLSLGFYSADWENLSYTPWKSVGLFEGEIFDPGKWKEVYPYQPIRQSQPADDYWAAKILAGLTQEHISVLVNAADYPEPGAAAYMIDTLMKRLRKVLRYALSRVSPLEVTGISGGMLQLKDLGRSLLGEELPASRYEALFYDERGTLLGRIEETLGFAEEFSLAVPDSLIEQAGGYLQVRVWIGRGEQKAPAPAQFHLSGRSRDELRLIGVVH